MQDMQESMANPFKEQPNDEFWHNAFARDMYFGGTLWDEVSDEGRLRKVKAARQRSIAGPPPLHS